MKKIILILGLFGSVSLYAGGIRTLKVNDKSMGVIHLKMGKASVLRFPEKPKKVVIGNQNYYSIEFIDNDLTIQPLGDVETNIFIYTPYHTYGFILKVCQSCRYDDLVYVKWKSKWKPPKKVKKKVTTLPAFKVIDLKFSVGKRLSVIVIKTLEDSTRGLRILDVQVKNITNKKLSLQTLRLFATRSMKPLPGQGYVVEKDELKPGEGSKVRLLLPLKEKRGFTLNALLEEIKGKIIVGRKYLK